jgi:hypothetical protein
MAKQMKLVPAARPFLKWAGGKTQFLDEFAKRLPVELKGKKSQSTWSRSLAEERFTSTSTEISLLNSVTSAMSMKS